ncbi:MAG: DUF5704 domain-containing protein [Mobilitalea sp.]
MYKLRSKKIVSLFIVMVILINGLVPLSTKADAAGEDESKYIVYNSDREPILTVTMEDGIITIIGISKKGTSSVRWETSGISITTKAITDEVSTKNRTGPGPVSSAGNAPVLWFKDGQKEDVIAGDTVITTITYPANKVEWALKTDFYNIKKNTYIYLHCIFQTYNFNVETQTRGSIRKDNLRNWKDIMEAESWGSGSLDDFEKYFNMTLKFKPQKQENTLYYQTKDSTPISLGSKQLASVVPGETVSWSNENEQKTKDGDTYKLIGYYVTKKGSSSKIVSKYTSDGWKISDIKSNKVEVELGGMNVYLIYDKLQKNTLYYQTDDAIPVSLGLKQLDSVVAGDTVSWSNEEEHKTKGTDSYELIGYYVTKKGSTAKIVSRYKEDGWKISQIKSNKAEVESGGMNIYLVYKKGVPVTPTPTISVTPTVTPTVTPSVTPIPTPTPTPTIPPIIIPSADNEYSSFTKDQTTGVIRADIRNSEKFTVTLGIPTTESLYGQVVARDYLLGYSFEKKVGVENYKITVSKDYILKWNTATPLGSGGPKTVTETVTVEQTVIVPRAYGYWEILNLDYFTINQAELQNYALPNGKITITPNTSYYDSPSIFYYHSSSKDYHLIPPEEVEHGITLPSETIISENTTKPTIKEEDFSYFALVQTGKIKVRSDLLLFDGNTVMSNQIKELETPNIEINYLPQCTTVTDENVLYKNNQVILATKKNGVYSSYGTIIYKAIAQVNSTRSSQLTYFVNGLEDVVIHTSVICDPIVTADNNKYVQLLSPTSNHIPLVLDPDSSLSDFTVNISNTGFHTGITGYYTRDYSKSLHNSMASYIAAKNGLLRNEVKFPFDVFVDVGSDNKNGNDDYVKAETWITIGKNTARFYLPTWTKEGFYKAEFRTVAVNGEDSLTSTETYANKTRSRYVATSSKYFEVSGRIYGLKIYDIADYPIWEETFRVPKSSDFKKDISTCLDGTRKTNYSKNYSYTYALGTNDQYGKDTGRNIKYTFPLTNGSHPYYKNQGILKTGYMVRFSLDTIGTMFSDGSSVVIKPSFYFVDLNGENRTAVDLYYSEDINGKNRNLVKVGSALDSVNIKSYTTGDLGLAIPRDEMQLTAALRGMKYGKYFWQKSGMFTFSKVQLNYAFRTLIGQEYAANIKMLDSFDDIVASGIKESDAEKSMQRWYGQYYIPNLVHVVKKDFDVLDYADKYGVDYSEKFWLTDGYIIVNLNIYTVDSSGNKRLSYLNSINYTNNGNCSMWVMEGPPLSKTSSKGPTFRFYAGDAFIYYSCKKMGDDYTTGAIY